MISEGGGTKSSSSENSFSNEFINSIELAVAKRSEQIGGRRGGGGGGGAVGVSRKRLFVCVWFVWGCTWDRHTVLGQFS